MSWRNTPERWGNVAIALHWLVALAIIATAALGWVMRGLPNSPAKFEWYALHKSLGLTILGLLLLRLLWRSLVDRPRPMLRAASRVQRVLAGATHAALYAVALAMALSGWAYNGAAGFGLRWFGTVSVPAVLGRDPALKATLAQVHLVLFFVLAALLALHVAAALKHHWIDRDDTLRRIWPRGRPRPETEP